MEEEVRRILSESTTKTSKIQKLLRLGLTRSQIADLVTMVIMVLFTMSIKRCLRTEPSPILRILHL